MLVINGVQVNTDLLSLLQTLKGEMLEQQINGLGQFKVSSDNIQTNCPFHANGLERKPSFGIQTHSGKCHCFSCGYSGDLFTAISQIFSFYDNGLYGKKWVLKNFNTVEYYSRQPLELNLTREKTKAEIKTVVQEDLSKYRYYHDYMYARGLTNRVIKTFDVGYDSNTNCLTFPVYDTSNSLIYVARRSVATKYFNIPSAVDKPIYALNNCIEQKANKVVITESILNCLTLWKLGIPAVSLMGTGSKHQYEILKKSHIRHYVLALDPDIAGQNGQEKLRQHLSKHKVITQIKYIDPLKDINDLDVEFLKLTEIL